MQFEETNKRGEVRKRLGAPALVRVDHRIVRCQVRDVSRTGAMLVFDEEVMLPDEITMSFGERPGTSRHARVMWRDGRSFGVAFRVR